jgi:hypothetical protein
VFVKSPFHRFGVQLNKKAETIRDRRVSREEERRLLDTALREMNTASHITGGKVLRTGTRPVINRATTALRLAATTLLRSQSYLGAQYRRFRSKLGAPKAVTAMAHKLARLVYRMLRWGQEYVDKGMQYYEERHRQQQIRLLQKRAAKLGFLIVEPQIS